MEFNQLKSVFKVQSQIHSSEKKENSLDGPYLIMDYVQNYGWEESKNIVTWKIYSAMTIMFRVTLM